MHACASSACAWQSCLGRLAHALGAPFRRLKRHHQVTILHVNFFSPSCVFQFCDSEESTYELHACCGYCAGACVTSMTIALPAGDIHALRESSSQWNKMSASLQADIPQQPAMLKGGSLRDYQMTVRLTALLFLIAEHALAMHLIDAFSSKLPIQA